MTVHGSHDSDAFCCKFQRFPVDCLGNTHRIFLQLFCNIKTVSRSCKIKYHTRFSSHFSSPRSLPGSFYFQNRLYYPAVTTGQAASRLFQKFLRISGLIAQKSALPYGRRSLVSAGSDRRPQFCSLFFQLLNTVKLLNIPDSQSMYTGLVTAIRQCSVS